GRPRRCFPRAQEALQPCMRSCRARGHHLQSQPAKLELCEIKDQQKGYQETTFMKVVLFCGGLGLRLRDYADHIPKPMVPIGNRPILWHVMKYFAYFGYNQFILCLGYRCNLIKEYFLD